MAVVKFFDRCETEARLNPTETAASYRVGRHDGKKILQVQTVGSANRKQVGKCSQTLQLTESSAYELYRILQMEFGFKE